MTILLIVGVVVILGILAIAIISIRSRREDVIEERLGRYTEPSSFMVVPEAQEEESKEKGPSLITRMLDSSLQNQGFAQSWRQQLARADIKLTVSEYLAAHVIAAVGVGALFFTLWGPILAIIGAGVGLLIPRFYVSYVQGKRFRTFEQQLPDILGLWVNALRSGYSVMQALEAISREAPEPSAKEVRRVVQEVQLGITMEDALDHLLVRMPSDDLDLVVTAVNIQREVGGNLAEILEVIGHTIRERIKLKGEIRVLTSQGRITGYLISGLPIVLGAFLMLINPHYMGNLFENRLCGWPMIGLGLGMIGIGTAVIQKIVDIEM